MIPYSEEAERGILSAVMMFPEEVGGYAAEHLDSESFLNPIHRTIFECQMERWRESKPLDLISFTDFCRGKGILDQIGGVVNLNELFTPLSTVHHVPHHVEILGEKRALRRVQQLCRDFQGRTETEQDAVAELLADLERQALEVAEGKQEKDQSFKSIVTDSVKRFQEANARGGRMKGLRSGLVALDDLTAGFCDQDLVIISAETSGGKTALALRFAESFAVDCGHPVLIFSFEMSKEELSDRMLCSLSKFDLLDFRRGRDTSNAYRLASAAETLASAPIIIRDAPDTGITQMRAVARRMKRKRGIRAVIVDYLQLIPSAPGRRENREQEVATISRGLKAMAKELNLPVIALSQLNDDGKVRESRAIAHDANLLLVIQEEEGKDGHPSQHFIKIAKQRNGPRERVPVRFIKHCARFEGVE